MLVMYFVSFCERNLCGYEKVKVRNMPRYVVFYLVIRCVIMLCCFSLCYVLLLLHVVLYYAVL
jgi:hypothetical protein